MLAYWFVAEVAKTFGNLDARPKALATCRFTEPTALAAGLVVITQPFEARG